MKKGSLIASAYNAETNTLTISVGEAGSVDLAINDLTDELRLAAMVHGFRQKLSDAAAMPRAELPDDPKKAAKVKLDAITVVRDRLTSGDWAKKSGEGAGPVAGLIFRAYSEFVGNRANAAKKPVPSEEAIKTQYNKLSRSEVLALRNVPEIATIIDRIKSERGPVTAVDADSLLGELGI